MTEWQPIETAICGVVIEAHDGRDLTLCEEDARAIAAALGAAGFQIVPKQPTEEMVEAAYSPPDVGAEGETGLSRREVVEIWETMLAAAPK